MYEEGDTVLLNELVRARIQRKKHEKEVQVLLRIIRDYRKRVIKLKARLKKEETKNGTT